MSFPKGFFWGGAVSASQWEGAYNVDGRGLVSTDCATAGSVDTERKATYINPDGTVGTVGMMMSPPKGGKLRPVEGYYYPYHDAIDSYHRYKEDIALLAEEGFTMFRMSISWARIYPTGIEEKPNQKGLDFYRNMFLEMKKYNIEPLVTLCHYDTPLYIEENLGGWENRNTISLYDKFTETVFREYKDLVKYWVTFNEINATVLFKDLFPSYPADLVKNDYQKLHYQFVAAARAVRKAHEINPDNVVCAMIGGGPSSYSLTCDPKDVLHNELCLQESSFYALDVMMRGEYPYYAKRIWKKYNVDLDFTEQDRIDLKEGCSDMATYSYYCTAIQTTHSDAETMDSSGFGNMNKKNPYLKYTKWGWSIDPDGLRYTLNLVYGRYGKPIMIIENGLGAVDVLEDDKKVHDPYRIEFMREHIKAMKAAVEEDGVDLRGYTTWGCLDIISATTGEMKKRYGTIYVDRNNDGSGTLERYKKDSFYYYQKVIASNGEDLD